MARILRIAAPKTFTLFFRASIYLTGCKTKSRRAIFPCPFFVAGSLPPRVSTARYWPDDFLPTRRFPRYNFVIHDSFASVPAEINVASRVLERQRLPSIKRSAPSDRPLNCCRQPISISSLIDRSIGSPADNFKTVLFQCAKAIPSFHRFMSNRQCLARKYSNYSLYRRKCIAENSFKAIFIYTRLQRWNF